MMPGIHDDEALDRFIRGCKKPIRVELERAYNRAKDRGESLDLMETMWIDETDNRFTSDQHSHFSAKKSKYGRKQVSAIHHVGCVENEGSNFSEGKKDEMSSNDDE